VGAFPVEVMGEKVGAVVVPRPGIELLDPEDVITFAREQNTWPTFKVPSNSSLLRSEALPRNPGGNILKGCLRKGVEWGNSLR
jgi:acyl-CoA synthetase (AMP-forming)/AMP-acid ligase II